MRGFVVGSFVAAAMALFPQSGHSQSQLALAQQHIQHVIIIMQENRSFDSYFGTYQAPVSPYWGQQTVNGIPGYNPNVGEAQQTGTPCYPQPSTEPTGGWCAPPGGQNPNGLSTQSCVQPFHDRSNYNAGGRHNNAAALDDVNDNNTAPYSMLGFLNDQQSNASTNGTTCNPGSVDPACAGNTAGLQRCDAVGYHVGYNADGSSGEIPYYWDYARNFVLQDSMFEPVESYSFPSHQYLLSAWSQDCGTLKAPLTGANCYLSFEPGQPSTNLPWNNITYLLDTAGVTWKYYLKEGSAPDCDDGEMTCSPVQQVGGTVPSIWNPIPGFANMVSNPAELAKNDVAYDQFYADLNTGNLPAVSWIVPNGDVSEHPPSGVQEGMQYVAAIVNAVGQNPRYWNNTVIFVAWDDWGGLLDHVVPPTVSGDIGTTNNRLKPGPNVQQQLTQSRGYGLRVPALVVSAWAKPGFVDHQVLSFDSYLKFIEDLFLNSTRIQDPANATQADQYDYRTHYGNPIREAVTTVKDPVTGNSLPVGDLLNDFDFSGATGQPLTAVLEPTAIPAKFQAADSTGGTTVDPTTGLTLTLPPAGGNWYPLKWSAIDQNLNGGTDAQQYFYAPCPPDAKKTNNKSVPGEALPAKSKTLDPPAYFVFGGSTSGGPYTQLCQLPADTANTKLLCQESASDIVNTYAGTTRYYVIKARYTENVLEADGVTCSVSAAIWSPPSAEIAVAIPAQPQP